MSSNRLLLKFAGRYPLWIVVTVLLSFSGALFNGVSTALIVPILLNFLGQEIDLRGTPPIIQSLLSPFEGVPEEYRLGVMTGSIILAIALKNVSTYASSLVSSSLTRALTRDLREEGLRVLLDVDLDFYAKTRVGDVVNRLGGEVGRTASAINVGVRMVSTVITILVFLIILISISWQLTIASTVLLTFVALVNQYSIRRSRIFGANLSAMSRAYSISLLETLNGIRLVKSVGSEEQEFRNIQKLIREREKADFQAQANSAAIAPISEVAGIIALIAIVFLGRAFFSEQLEELSAILLTYLLVLFRLLPFVAQLNTSRSSFANTVASVEIVHDFLRRDNKPFMSQGQLPYTGMQKGIHFDHLSFRYPDHPDLVLQEVDLQLSKGTTLALVGSSGAGKSTLADLLPRFYDPTEGAIYIDGQDLRQFDVRSLRRSMGIVSQDTFLFNESVRNNIAYAKPDATDDEIRDALKRANAYEFVIRLPEGIETPIGDRGVMLSGGQRQRLAIARALLQNPEILVLDEATSALDTVSERLVQQAIDELSRDRTTLVIAHRLSTVQKADQIAVLDKGQVVELGTHEQLLNQGGHYARLYAMQFSDAADAQHQNVRREALMQQLSYEIRGRLNAMLGSLQFLKDDLVSSPEEQDELTQEAYDSAVGLLKVIERVEGENKTL